MRKGATPRGCPETRSAWSTRRANWHFLYALVCVSCVRHVSDTSQTEGSRSDAGGGQRCLLVDPVAREVVELVGEHVAGVRRGSRRELGSLPVEVDALESFALVDHELEVVAEARAQP